METMVAASHGLYPYYRHLWAWAIRAGSNQRCTLIGS